MHNNENYEIVKAAQDISSALDSLSKLTDEQKLLAFGLVLGKEKLSNALQVLNNISNNTDFLR